MQYFFVVILRIFVWPEEEVCKRRVKFRFQWSQGVNPRSQQRDQTLHRVHSTKRKETLQLKTCLKWRFNWPTARDSLGNEEMLIVFAETCRRPICYGLDDIYCLRRNPETFKSTGFSGLLSNSALAFLTVHFAGVYPRTTATRHRPRRDPP